MNWYNINKLIIRRGAPFIATLMLLLLINSVNLMGVEVIAKYGEIKAFTEEWFLADISASFNGLFVVLFAVFVFMLILSWKGFSEYKKSGVWLYNGAIGVLVVWFSGYVLSSLFTIRIFSWYTILAGLMALIFSVILFVNVYYFTKNKENMTEDENIKFPVGCFLLAIIIMAVFVNKFDKKYEKVWFAEYDKYCSLMERKGDGLTDEEITYKDYIKLQYANYFNPMGEQFTVEEFEKAVKNYNSGKGSWYALWYVWESRGCAVFYDYDYSSFGWGSYVILVERELMAKGIDPENATYEELEEACEYVYEVYDAQIIQTVLGEVEGEIVIKLELPESNNPEDIVLTYEGEGYFAVIDEWYQVENENEKIYSDSIPVKSFEAGCMYKARITIYPRVSYVFDPRTENGTYVEYKGNGVVDGKTTITSDRDNAIYDTICIEIKN